MTVLKTLPRATRALLQKRFCSAKITPAELEANVQQIMRDTVQPVCIMFPPPSNTQKNPERTRANQLYCSFEKVTKHKTLIFPQYLRSRGVCIINFTLFIKLIYLFEMDIPHIDGVHPYGHTKVHPFIQRDFFFCISHQPGVKLAFFFSR